MRQRARRGYPVGAVRRVAAVGMTVALAGVGFAFGTAVAGSPRTIAPPEDVSSEPIAIGPTVTLAGGSGSDLGLPVSWELNAFTSDKGLCVNFFGGHPSNQGSGGCGFGIGRGNPIGLLLQTFPSLNRTLAFGPTWAGVSYVRITAFDGTQYTAPALDVPTAVGFDGRVFVIALEGNSLRQVEALDSMQRQIAVVHAP